MNAISRTALPSELLIRLRAETPLVQCITNYVAMNVAANVVLAAGASPAMVHAAEEAGAFAGIAGAVTINIGTLSPYWLEGMRRAAVAARESETPWVLDPVAHFATAFRRDAAAELLDLRPDIVRGNASEILALAGAQSQGRGVDSQDPVDAAREAAESLARTRACVVAITGAEDFVTDGERTARITGGSPLMPKVTALGCSLTCLIGAFAAISPRDCFAATVAALACFAEAGETAHRHAEGPGSFSVAFLDALHALAPDSLDAETRVRWG